MSKKGEWPDLPRGCQYASRLVPQFEWKCPCATDCGKGDKTLYKAKTADQVIQRGAWHLEDEANHSNPKFSKEAEAKAPEGLLEGVKGEWYVIDDKGQEQPKPGPAQVVANRPLEKDSGDKFRFRDRSRRQQSRSRSPRSANAQPNRSSGSRDVVVPIQTLRPASDLRANAIVTAASFTNQLTTSNSVKISPIELDHLIDCTERNAATLEHMAAVCRSTAPMFENAARQIRDCKHFFERMKRL